MAAVFVTGTDTGCGKTYISECLLRGATNLGVSAAGMKPIATGIDPDSLENEDIVKLASASTSPPAPKLLNQYCFPEPCSPNIASTANQTKISLDKIHSAFESLRVRYDFVVVEAVGGWKVPIGKTESVADLAIKLDIPVVLVVGIRLGCINHAILTAESLRGSKVRVCGWAANFYDDTVLFPNEVLKTLSDNLKYPLLQIIRKNEHLKNSTRFAAALLEKVGRKNAAEL